MDGMTVSELRSALDRADAWLVDHKFDFHYGPRSQARFERVAEYRQDVATRMTQLGWGN